jgi:hypothetical protein
MKCRSLSKYLAGFLDKKYKGKYKKLRRSFAIHVKIEDSSSYGIETISVYIDKYTYEERKSLNQLVYIMKKLNRDDSDTSNLGHISVHEIYDFNECCPVKECKKIHGNMAKFLKEHTMEDLHIALHGYVRGRTMNEPWMNYGVDYFKMIGICDDIISESTPLISYIDKAREYSSEVMYELRDIDIIPISDMAYDSICLIHDKINVTLDDSHKVLRDYKDDIQFMYKTYRKYFS